MKPKIIAIVQARMGSKRLPGKMMMKINGKPLIFYVLRQISYSKMIDKIILATSENPANAPLLKYVESLGYKYFAGSEDDVLSRFINIAKSEVLSDNDLIVRITGDEPLIDPKIIDAVIKAHLRNNVDYSSTKEFRDGKLINLVVKGLDLEVISYNAFKRMCKHSKSAFDKEHVTPYIYNHPEEFSIFIFKPSIEMKHFIRDSKIVLTVDDINDFNFVSEIILHLYKEDRPISFDDISSFLANKKK